MERTAVGIREILIENIDDILKLILQKPPMVMIDKLISSDEKSTTTSLLINESNIFCNEGFFTEPGLIENMAQTAAVRVGYIAANLNKKIPVGFIGAIKDLSINFLPIIGSEIITKIIVEHEVLNATLISAKVESNGKTAAECEMKIFLKNIN